MKVIIKTNFETRTIEHVLEVVVVADKIPIVMADGRLGQIRITEGAGSPYAK